MGDNDSWANWKPSQSSGQAVSQPSGQAAFRGRVALARSGSNAPAPHSTMAPAASSLIGRSMGASTMSGGPSMTGGRPRSPNRRTQFDSQGVNRKRDRERSPASIADKRSLRVPPAVDRWNGTSSSRDDYNDRTRKRLSTEREGLETARTRHEGSTRNGDAEGERRSDRDRDRARDRVKRSPSQDIDLRRDPDRDRNREGHRRGDLREGTSRNQQMDRLYKPEKDTDTEKSKRIRKERSRSFEMDRDGDRRTRNEERSEKQKLYRRDDPKEAHDDLNKVNRRKDKMETSGQERTEEPAPAATRAREQDRSTDATRKPETEDLFMVVPNREEGKSKARRSPEGAAKLIELPAISIPPATTPLEAATLLPPLPQPSIPVDCMCCYARVSQYRINAM